MSTGSDHEKRAAAVNDLVSHWMLTDPGLWRVHWYDGEALLLLQVTASTLPSPEEVVSFGFYPTSERPWPMEIAQVTPEEFARILAGELSLPAHWPAAPYRVFDNPKVAVAS